MGQLLFLGNDIYKIKIDYFDFPIELEKKFFDKSGKTISEISFSGIEFLHAIVTCGMPAFHLNWTCCQKRANEIAYKCFLIKTALEVDKNGYIIVSDKIKYLDSSERVFISYYIGMFITKLISKEIFGYDYLVHLGIVSQYKKVIRGNSEPDLVGFMKKTDDYSLFEAKGRQAVKSKMIEKAKDQIKSVKYISGMKSTFGVVCVSHPIKEGNRVICSIYDPVLDNIEKMDVHKDELLYLYYLPIYELIRENGDGNPYCSFSIDENNDNRVKYHIEMPENLFRFFNRYPNFTQYEQERVGIQLMETISSLGDNRRDDLLSIEFCE